MTGPETTTSEARRLEELWSGSFGDAYMERNRDAAEGRGPFWHSVLSRYPCRRALEVGCNVGANLRWVAAEVGTAGVVGVDVNHRALAELQSRLPGIGALWAPGRDLPFRDGWFDLVFTMGVLIHQPDTTLPLVAAEMVRCSRRWVLCGEYFAAESTEVPYRDQPGALFKRDYGRLFCELFPDLELVETGFLGRDRGWDDVTWWLFAKP